MYRACVDSPNPEKAKDSAMVAQQTAEYLARGGRIEQVPVGATRYNVLPSLHEIEEANWRNRKVKGQLDD